jgi:hypothetical protein
MATLCFRMRPSGCGAKRPSYPLPEILAVLQEEFAMPSIQPPARRAVHAPRGPARTASTFAHLDPTPDEPDDDWDVDDPDLTYDASWELEEFEDDEEPEPEQGDFWRDDDFDE